tara:strand:+ start:793 stop:1113 length:321 start_codon:yes stop_codon:yes gene_type:complete
MKGLFILLIIIILFNNIKLYEGLDNFCDRFKNDIRNNCSIRCKDFNKTIIDNNSYFENNETGIKKFKIYILNSLNNILKYKSDCNKCMYCIIQKTSEELKNTENDK